MTRDENRMDIDWWIGVLSTAFLIFVIIPLALINLLGVPA